MAFATLLVLAPGLLYGTLSVFSSRTSLAALVRRQFADAAQNAADRVSALLRAQRESLASFARQDVMREIRIGDLDKRISSFLASLKVADPACLDLVALDRNGRIVAASDPGAIGDDGSALGGAGVDGSTEMAGPFASPLHDLPSLKIAARIPDPDTPRQTLGTLVALYEWDRELSALSRVRETYAADGVSVDVVMLDPDGMMIGGTAREAPVGAPYATEGKLFGEAALAGDLPRWSIVVSQPEHEAFAPVRRTAWILVFVLAATLVVALGVAVVAARRVTQPLADLTRAAEEIGKGRDGAPVPVRSGDEIGALATSFNRMAVDLRRAEKDLLDAAKFAFVGELAAGVAHEVRTPLGVMRSSAQLLERSIDGKDAETKELLTLLREEVDRIDHVVTGLLELGRPRELKLEAAPLGQVVFRAADFAEAQARERGVTIRRAPSVPDPVALCDPELVYQVALNLLVNAILILPTGGEVEVAVSAAGAGVVAFHVRDDGPGIPDAIREKIFQPFFTQRVGGAGLGLTFVQRVVQEHRGRVTVESAQGRGTTFRIELPAA